MSLKRKIVKVLAVTLATSLLVIGCNGKNDEGDNQNQENVNTEKITIGASGDFYPLNFKKDDKLQGFEIEMWEEIAKRANLELEYKIAKFTGLFGMLDAGQVDTVCHLVAVNEEREAQYDFTDPYLYSNYQLITKKGSDLDKLEDFKDKNIGVVMGGMGEKKLKEVNEKNNLNINIKGYEGTAAMDLDVEKGRLDARLGPAIQTKTSIEENNLNLEVTDVVIFNEIAAFPFAKNEESKGKIEKINKALNSMKEDGTLSKLSMKWFEEDATTEK